MLEKSINKQIKRTAKDSLYYLPTKIIPAIVGIVLIRILTTFFTPTEYGHYQITLATFGLINIFSVMWLSSSVMRFYLPAHKDGRTDAFLSTLFYGSVVGAFIFAALAFLIVFSVRTKISPQLYSLMNIAILATFINAFFEIFVVAFRAALKPKKYAVYWIAFSAGKPLLGVALIYFFNFRVEGIFWAFVFVPLLLNIWLFREFSLFRILKTTKPQKDLFSQLNRYGSQISLTFLAFWVLSFSDRYLIEYFASTDQVGFYSVGYSISEKTLNFLYTILMLAAYPIIIDNWENKGKEYTQSLITELLKYYLILFTPVLLVLIIMPENMLLLFADQSFLPGARVLPLIATGIFFYGLSQYAVKGFELYKKTSRIAIIALIVSLLNIILNIVLIPRIGIVGAGISSCVSYAAYFVLAMSGTRSYMSLNLPWRTLRVLSLGSSIFAAILWWGTVSMSNFLIQVFVVAPIGLIIYFIVLYLFGEINSSVLKLSLRIIRGAFVK